MKVAMAEPHAGRGNECLISALTDAGTLNIPRPKSAAEHCIVKSCHDGSTGKTGSPAPIPSVSMMAAMTVLYRNTPQDMDMTDAVDIINYSVYNYCPEYWPQLVAFGEGARS